MTSLREQVGQGKKDERNFFGFEFGAHLHQKSIELSCREAQPRILTMASMSCMHGGEAPPLPKRAYQHAPTFQVPFEAPDGTLDWAEV